VEPLEDRRVLSTLTVTSALDNFSPGTLRSQIAQANLDADNGVSDRIVFDDHQMGTDTITLTQGVLAYSGSVGATLDIDGGGTITIDGDHASTVFAVASSATAGLSGLTITGGKADFLGGGAIHNQGTLTVSGDFISGNTASACGGIMNDRGTVNVESSTFSGNSAVEGEGGAS
jgi:fibronectin-binding autotransporter adhesin